MSKYIYTDKLRAEIERRKKVDGWCAVGRDTADVYYARGFRFACDFVLNTLDSFQQEQDKMRYCIEYINPLHPLLDNGVLNIRHLRVPDEHSAEMALTLMLSFGAKIYALYRGNIIDGKLGEWSTPMIVDADDWYSASWLHDILDCGLHYERTSLCARLEAQ